MSITTGLVCALIVLADVVRNPPHMAVMRAVWPICTVGDIIAEPLVLLPANLVPLGYPGLFSDQIFAVWVLN